MGEKVPQETVFHAFSTELSTIRQVVQYTSATFSEISFLRPKSVLLLHRRNKKTTTKESLRCLSVSRLSKVLTAIVWVMTYFA